MMTTAKSLFFLAAILFLVSGCASTRRTDLFFGMNIPGGGRVSAEQWKNFNDSIIAPRFPEGYTEYDAMGKWLDTATKATIAEHTKVVTFIGKKSKRRDAIVDSVIQAYIHRYKQQAVLRVDMKYRAEFVTGKKMER
jgi:hypothetical protein